MYGILYIVYTIQYTLYSIHLQYKLCVLCVFNFVGQFQKIPANNLRQMSYTNYQRLTFD